MLAARLTVSQTAASALRSQRTAACCSRLATFNLQCAPYCCMSLAPRVTTSPEGTKRRRLSTAASLQIQSSPKMAPALIQEVEDEPTSSETLELTPVETTLRQLLLDVAKYIDNSPTSSDMESQVHLPEELANETIVLRFTGGWVRDKLLGVASHDIDVAINKMTGYQFGLKLKEYLEIPGNPEKYGLEGVATSDKQSQKAGATDKSKTVGGLHKIEANPEKSKHLETVTTKILGLDIDLVNLRKETYTDESRNPQMEFGTPEEDAMRRDATVNAMFYNVNTQQVEDFTGRGHDDMREKIIRTPLEPYQTFKDDPLRVLRLIRFASRLDYNIDVEARRAMRNPEIKDALKRKISRERVGIEIEKALRGPDPHEALRLIFDLDLYETIFSDPTIETADHYKPVIGDWQAVIDCVRETLDTDSALSDVLVRDNEDRFLAWQLAAFVPYNDAPQPEPPEPGRRAPPPIAVSVAREGIKANNRISDIITASVRNQSEISGYVDKLAMQKRRSDKKIEGEDASARDVLGMAIRRWGSNWRAQVMYSMLVEVAESSDAVTPIERKYAAFLQHLSDLNILEAYTFKPLMDGKSLAKALNTNPGPWMKDALDVVMAYQLRHPEKATVEAAIAEVQSHNQKQQQRNGGELTSSLVHHFLKLTIRPLFIKAKPSSITDTGRKNTTTILPKKMTGESMDESVSKPWKAGRETFALDLLRWCVEALDEKLVEEVWPMIIPPLLTLVDDWEAKYKQLGAKFIGRVLEATPPPLLAKTGLGEVFEDALLPCLTHLPTITPQEESQSLLDAVYPTLLTLTNVRYPTASDQRIKSLDTIVRKGIIHGYTHCPNHPVITSTLFTHLVPLLNALGIDSLKHLKYLLPILTDTLSHPLADAQTTTLHSATKALQAVLLNCWPRMLGHRGEILKGLTMCWVHVFEMEGEGVEVLRGEMREAARVLRFVVGEEVDFEGEFGRLVEAEPRVAGLFDGKS